MEITLPAFTPMQQSLFLTLCGRALDNRSPHPILADTVAEELVRKLHYDCGRFRLSASPILNIALRAKKLDQVAQGFITRHPDAVALDLGAGLDTRMFRINPPATVDWYDVDYPEVITARQQLLPDRANAHGIGADLTDPDWLDKSRLADLAPTAARLGAPERPAQHGPDGTNAGARPHCWRRSSTRDWYGCCTCRLSSGAGTAWCPLCGRRWPLDEVEPCPWPAQVRLWDQEGKEQVVCRSHAAHPSAARLVAIEEDPR